MGILTAFLNNHLEFLYSHVHLLLRLRGGMTLTSLNSKPSVTTFVEVATKANAEPEPDILEGS